MSMGYVEVVVAHVVAQLAEQELVEGGVVLAELVGDDQVQVFDGVVVQDPEDVYLVFLGDARAFFGRQEELFAEAAGLAQGRLPSRGGTRPAGLPRRT